MLPWGQLIQTSWGTCVVAQTAVGLPSSVNAMSPVDNMISISTTFYSTVLTINHSTKLTHGLQTSSRCVPWKRRLYAALTSNIFYVSRATPFLLILFLISHTVIILQNSFKSTWHSCALVKATGILDKNEQRYKSTCKKLTWVVVLNCSEDSYVALMSSRSRLTRGFSRSPTSPRSSTHMLGTENDPIPPPQKETNTVLRLANLLQNYFNYFRVLHDHNKGQVIKHKIFNLQAGQIFWLII